MLTMTVIIKVRKSPASDLTIQLPAFVFIKYTTDKLQ